MQNGKVISLYVTMPDMMRAGHRMRCDDIECDSDGIMGDIHYDTERDYVMMLTSQMSYDIAKEAGIVIENGVLMESIHVDVDLYHLKKGSLIEIGDTILEVEAPCEVYGYLMALDPALPELLEGKRGLFVRPVDHGQIFKDDEVKVLKEA